MNLTFDASYNDKSNKVYKDIESAVSTKIPPSLYLSFFVADPRNIQITMFYSWFGFIIVFNRLKQIARQLCQMTVRWKV